MRHLHPTPSPVIAGIASVVALLALAAPARADTWTSTADSQPIPDLGTATLPIEVDAAFEIRDVNVLVTLTHPSLAQITVVLRHPDGTEVLLAQAAPGMAFMHTAFDDEAVGPLSGSSPYTASFQPAEPLTALDGKTSAGTWRVRAVDGGAGVTGNLRSATLAFDGLTFVSADVPKAIPEFGNTTTSLIVGADVDIADLDVSFYIDHTYPQDLIFDLLGPTGIQVALLHSVDVSGFGTGFRGTTFDDEASANINQADDPYHGRFLPEPGGAMLGGFDDLPTAGTWTLFIQDFDFSDSGTVRGWSVHVTPQGPCADVVASAQSYGDGTAGALGVPALEALTDPEPGQAFSLLLGSSSGAATQALLVAGFVPASIPGKGGVLLVEPAFDFTLPLPAAGLVLPAVLPADANLCGLHLFLQTLQADAAAPQGVAFSAGLHLTFGA